VTPVVQTITSVEEGGNCLAACLASVLEIPLDAVPNAAKVWARDPYAQDPDVTAEGWKLVRDWLARLGLDVWNLGGPDDLGDWRPDGYWLGVFESPRLAPATHIVVCRGSDVVWDPHPAASEQPVQPETLRSVYVLVAADPVKLARGLTPGGKWPFSVEARPT